MPPEKVADHVWVMRQPDRVWSAVIGNVEIIEQSDGVVLVDSGGTIPDGRDVLAAVAKLTSKPIKAVIITHWHNDHPLGIPAILERFPKARVISTATTAKLMADPEILNVGVGATDGKRAEERMKASEQRTADYLKSSTDPSFSPAVQREYAIEAGWVMIRAKRQMGNYVALPTETFTDRLTIDDPVTPVEALYLGRANTKGDAFVWLPRQKVMVAGDAVVAPSPYGFDNPIRPWLATLDRLENYDFRILVPGHGKVQHDRAYLATLRWSMEDVRRQAAEVAKSGATPEEAANRFDRSEQQRRFAANDAWTKRWLNEYWLDGMFSTAFKQAKGIPLGQAIDGGD
jgi:glyoxylase-like metal-dependent hydrolase (beta-lactamase superfamily II)